MIFYLVGFMGCGKSTIGRELSRRTGLPYLDTDKMIEQETGSTVAEIFSTRGEDFFRGKEKEIIERISRESSDKIVATGGGLPCREGRIELMNETGATIYLKMSVPNLFSRLKAGKHRRPVLAGTSDETLRERIEQMLSSREKYYERASLVIDCDGVSDAYICTHIERYITMKPETVKNGAPNDDEPERRDRI